MANPEQERKKNQIKDIQEIEFGGQIDEITSSLQIVLTLFHHDDDPEIIQACKDKLQEGVDKLKSMGAEGPAGPYKQAL